MIGGSRSALYRRDGPRRLPWTPAAPLLAATWIALTCGALGSVAVSSSSSASLLPRRLFVKFNSMRSSSGFLNIAQVTGAEVRRSRLLRDRRGREPGFVAGADRRGFKLLAFDDLFSTASADVGTMLATLSSFGPVRPFFLPKPKRSQWEGIDAVKQAVRVTSSPSSWAPRRCSFHSGPGPDGSSSESGSIVSETRSSSSNSRGASEGAAVSISRSDGGADSWDLLSNSSSRAGPLPGAVGEVT